jgi:hypothetical protein
MELLDLVQDRSQLSVELLVGAEERLPVRLVALRLPAHLAFAIIVAPMLTTMKSSPKLVADWILRCQPNRTRPCWSQRFLREPRKAAFREQVKPVIQW